MVAGPSRLRQAPLLVLIAADAAAVAIVFALGWSEMHTVAYRILFRAPTGVGIALLAGQTLPAAFRRLAPLTVVAVAIACQGIAGAMGFGPTNALLALPFALYWVAFIHPRRVAIGLTVGSLAILLPLTWRSVHVSVPSLLLITAIFGTAALAGDGAKARRLYAEAVATRAAEAEARRAQETRNAVAAERARLARELHDAVGHTVNVLVLHAGAGRVASVADPSRAASVLAEIEDIGRAALTDIDRLLGLLRDGDDDPPMRRPAPGLVDIPALVERLGNTGVPIHLATSDLERAVPTTVAAAAYRIVQESLTNTIKHAGPATVTVDVRVGDHDVTVVVDDDGVGPSATAGERVGRGLIGMRERVALLGGELYTGARPGGGFHVCARLPIDAPPGGVR